ncbi:MAG TPA: CpaF family protein [Candidatus Angelobacter sp.]|jgi:pilus assembly protein CpaF|nr:CpaF family protein [Candidatus Angelobacter sp.]
MIVQLADRTDRPGPAYLDALGPLRPLVEDESLTEIMVNGPGLVYVERNGRLEETDVRFADTDELLNVITEIARAVGRRIDAHNPICDARLLDGSRVAASIPPVAVNGPLLTIRKFSRNPLRIDDLIARRSLDQATAELLHAAVLARCNIVVSGGTGSGKTTLLNVISGFIPSTERIVTIEDAAELQLHQRHVCTLEARPARDGDDGITIRDLVHHSLRMRPDRIVVGECRGGEALDMLQAMNTGHDGSLTTIHANSPRDALSRLETLVLMADVDLPLRAIRQQVAGALDIIVQLSRLRDGSRRVTAVTEVLRMESETITMQELVRFEARGMDAEGRIMGELVPAGVRPELLATLEAMGLPLPSMFAATSRRL